MPTGENTLVVAGRTFRPVIPARLEHYQYVTGQLLAAGALFEATVGEQVGSVTEAGRGPAVLAGLYVETGVDGERRPWTIKAATLTAKAFAASEDPDDWNAMTLALLFGLRRFFGEATDSSPASPPSSAATSEASVAPTSESPVPSGSPS